MSEMVQTVPAEFRCQTLTYADFKQLEDVVKATALLSRNRNWTRMPTLVTDDATLLVKPKQQYVASKLKAYDGKLYGVTWSTRNVEGYQMWLNPKMTPKRMVMTTLHELCHAMVATGTSRRELQEAADAGHVPLERADGCRRGHQQVRTRANPQVHRPARQQLPGGPLRVRDRPGVQRPDRG